ncbi:MAG: hypothetical protein ACYCQI_11550 [Gammaproteobacteria bacterium]
MANSKVVKAIFGTYLSIRDSEAKLQEPKKAICKKFIQQAEEANSNELTIALAKSLSDEMQQELSREQGYLGYIESWIPTFIYKRNYLLHKTLHAALAYVVSELEKDKVWEQEKAKLELNKDFIPQYHLSYFDEVIKLDKQTSLLSEANFSDFELHAEKDLRDTAIFDKVFKAPVESLTAEAQAIANVSQVPPADIKAITETAVATAPLVSVDPIVSANVEKPASDKPAEAEAKLEVNTAASSVVASSPEKSIPALTRVITDAVIDPRSDVDSEGLAQAIKPVEAKREQRLRLSRWDMKTPITEKSFVQSMTAKKDGDDVKSFAKTNTVKKWELPPVTSAQSHSLFVAPKDPHEARQYEVKPQHHHLRQRGKNATIKLGR